MPDQRKKPKKPSAQDLVLRATENWSLVGDTPPAYEIHHSDESTEHRFLAPAEMDAVRSRLQRWAHHAADGGLAPNTLLALRHDLTAYFDWCYNTGRIGLPATQATLEAYLETLSQTRKISTLRRYLSSISALHRAASLADPTKGALVKSMVNRIANKQAQHDKAARKSAGKKKPHFAKRQAAGLRSADLRALDTLFGDSLRDIRDRALVWLAFDTLARSSEICAIQVDELKSQEDGSMTLFLPHTKSDQHGRGQFRYVSAFTAERLHAWMHAADIAEGALFRGVNRRMQYKGRGKPPQEVEKLGEGISRQTVYLIIKRAAQRLFDEGVIKTPVSGYSSHSARVGAAQEMLSRGLSLLQVQQAGGWKSESMPAEYGKAILARESGSAKLAAMENRTKRSTPDE